MILGPEMLAQETVVEEKDTETARLQELMNGHTRTTTVAAGDTLSEEQ